MLGKHTLTVLCITSFLLIPFFATTTHATNRGQGISALKSKFEPQSNPITTPPTSSSSSADKPKWKRPWPTSQQAPSVPSVNQRGPPPPVPPRTYPSRPDTQSNGNKINMFMPMSSSDDDSDTVIASDHDTSMSLNKGGMPSMKQPPSYHAKNTHPYSSGSVSAPIQSGQQGERKVGRLQNQAFMAHLEKTMNKDPSSSSSLGDKPQRQVGKIHGKVDTSKLDALFASHSSPGALESTSTPFSSQETSQGENKRGNLKGQAALLQARLAGRKQQEEGGSSEQQSPITPPMMIDMVGSGSSSAPTPPPPMPTHWKPSRGGSGASTPPLSTPTHLNPAPSNNGPPAPHHRRVDRQAVCFCPNQVEQH